MRYEPYEDEYAAVPTMDDEELLEYFLYRILETDEVWGLNAGTVRMNRVIDGKKTQPVWPYKRFAAEAVTGEWQDCQPVPDALEYFMYQILNQLAMQDVLIEVMPRTTGAGCLITAQRLLTFLEDMKEMQECTIND